MTDCANLIQMLENANENNTNIAISYSPYDDSYSVAMYFVPDILIQGNWISIVDKEKGERSYFSFELNSDIEFDKDEEEYFIPVGDGELIIAVR